MASRSRFSSSTQPWMSPIAKMRPRSPLAPTSLLPMRASLREQHAEHARIGEHLYRGGVRIDRTGSHGGEKRPHAVVLGGERGMETSLQLLVDDVHDVADAPGF